MTEQNYKELTEALKHSEIPLQMQMRWAQSRHLPRLRTRRA